MTAAGLLKLVGQDLGRTRGPLATAGFSIAVGIAALVFFLTVKSSGPWVTVFPISVVWPMIDLAATSNA